MTIELLVLHALLKHCGTRLIINKMHNNSLIKPLMSDDTLQCLYNHIPRLLEIAEVNMGSNQQHLNPLCKSIVSVLHLLIQIMK